MMIATLTSSTCENLFRAIDNIDGFWDTAKQDKTKHSFQNTLECRASSLDRYWLTSVSQSSNTDLISARGAPPTNGNMDGWVGVWPSF